MHHFYLQPSSGMIPGLTDNLQKPLAIRQALLQVYEAIENLVVSIHWGMSPAVHMSLLNHPIMAK